MKTLIIFLVLLSGTTPQVFSYDNYDLPERIIGVSVYRSESKSGYGPSLNMGISIENERRHLEFGFIYQNEMQKFSGGEILYKHYFRSAINQDDVSGFYNNARFFFQYNFIFRYSNLPDRISENVITAGEMITGGRVATFEHYLGAGILYRLVNNFCVSAGLGYGISLGSIDNKFLHEPHYSEGGRKTDSGLITKIGVVYFFNR